MGIYRPAVIYHTRDAQHDQPWGTSSKESAGNQAGRSSDDRDEEVKRRVPAAGVKLVLDLALEF